MYQEEGRAAGSAFSSLVRTYATAFPPNGTHDIINALRVPKGEVCRRIIPCRDACSSLTSPRRLRGKRFLCDFSGNFCATWSPEQDLLGYDDRRRQRRRFRGREKEQHSAESHRALHRSREFQPPLPSQLLCIFPLKSRW